MTIWVCLVALLSTISAAAYGARPPRAAMIGFDATTSTTIGRARGLLLPATALNYSFGRDRMITGSGVLLPLSTRLHVPPYALPVAALIIVCSVFSSEALTRIIGLSLPSCAHASLAGGTRVRTGWAGGAWS